MRKPKPCPACGCHYGASIITALRVKCKNLENDVQVAKGQYEGACIIIKQLEEKCAELQANLSHFQESEFHPDWSLLKATRESLLEHQGLCRMLQAKLDEAATNLPAIIEQAKAEERESALKDMRKAVIALAHAAESHPEYQAAYEELDAAIRARKP